MIRLQKTFLYLLLLLQISFVSAQQSTVIEKEIKLGDQYAKMVEAEMGIWKHDVMQQYIDQVGQRLIKTLPKQPYPYTFQIVDQWEPNAFSIPGGHVYISRGLMVLLKTESELAGVLGHEVGHIIAHHSLKVQKRSVYASILAIPGVVVGALTGNKALENVLLVPAVGLGKAYLASYGRSQEYEADKLGIEISAKAGYDLNGLPNILDRLEDDITLLLNGKKHVYSIFDDHPMTPKRVERLHKLAKKYEGMPRIPDLKNGNAFLKVWDGLLYGPNAAEGIFIHNEFIHPELKLKILFPEKWQCVNEKTVVGAIAEDQKSLIALSFATNGHKADSLQANAIDKLKQKNITPISTSKEEINGLHVTRIKFLSSAENGTLVYIWISYIEKDKFTYSLMGQSTSADDLNYSNTLQSFNSITAEDIARIKVTTVRIAEYQKGETFEKLTDRTGNKFGDKMFYLVNGVSQAAELNSDVNVKVLVEEKYK